MPERCSKLSPSGQETIPYYFAGAPDGIGPQVGLVRDAEGNLYGTTNSGGTSNWGTVFKVTPAGKETVLHSFSGGADGGGFPGALILDAQGNLYGTTYAGGSAEGYSAGTTYAGRAYDTGVIFRLTTCGGDDQDCDDQGDIN